MSALRAKPAYMADGYLDWKLDEVYAIGYAVGRAFHGSQTGVIHANEFGEFFAARTTNWADADRLYDQFTKEAA